MQSLFVVTPAIRLSLINSTYRLEHCITILSRLAVASSLTVTNAPRTYLYNVFRFCDKASQLYVSVLVPTYKYM